KGFEKIFLEPGESTTVSFTLTANELFFFSEVNEQYEVAIGDYVAHVGGSSDALMASQEFTTIAAQPKTDLEVTRIFSYPRYPETGDSVLFMALVKNQGTMDFTPEMPLNLSFEVNGTLISTTNFVTDTIYAGGAILMTATDGPNSTPFWVPQEDGEYEISALIDSENSYDEWIETNNEYLTTILVNGTDGPIVANLCYLKPATSSSSESFSLGPEHAVDGDFGTRWSSQFSDPEFIQVDLLDVYLIDQLALAWETAYSSEYRVEFSVDGIDYTEIVYEPSANGGNDIYFPDAIARYIRVEGLARATEWGHSLYEIQAFGELASQINEQEPSTQIELYPNPASQEFTLKNLPLDDVVTITIHDRSGRLVFQETSNAVSQLRLSTESINSGTYVVQVKGQNHHESILLVVQ
ncbi:MAG: discoidin domain-containing protein, partial [Bacteroidota bacterium]